MIAIIWGIFIGASIVYKINQKNPKSENKIPIIWFQSINPSDPDYATKTLTEIRKYLTNTYYPMHSWAHLPVDMKPYTTDKELITIIEQLEEIEFSGKKPDEKIIESIQQDLIKKLSL